ncbi:hypothetical protein ZWY2020_028432 [Hordeum vulgare]|nr:hypothetical protein ZWY2020_028432 [Hordeum vulgare]
MGQEHVLEICVEMSKPSLDKDFELAYQESPTYHTDAIRNLSRDLAATMADNEPVDPKNFLEERCKPQCVKSLYDYERCVKRVENDETGQKHCTGQFFDYWSCVDKCVAPKLFEKLK